jgi:hypothetical protein
MPTLLPPLVMVLSLLTLLAPGKARAGPPEGVSGRMVLDEVAEGLRRRGYDLQAEVERLRRQLDEVACASKHQAGPFATGPQGRAEAAGPQA